MQARWDGSHVSGCWFSVAGCWLKSPRRPALPTTDNQQPTTNNQLLNGDLAPQHLPEHHPVSEQAVERVLEGRGAILLVHEMTEPGEPVAAQRCADQPPGIAGCDRNDDPRDHQPRADEVQTPAATIGVLAEIVRIELAEAGEVQRRHGSALGERDEFLIVAGNQAEPASRPVALGLLDPLARGRDEIP